MGRQLFGRVRDRDRLIDDSKPEGERFVPDTHAILAYCRTLAYRRPYCLLLNTRLDNLTHELMVKYFNLALFWGFYPSVYSENAATILTLSGSSSWSVTASCSKSYIPIIRRMNCAGWQPVTHATTSDPRVLVERFGRLPHLYLTLRNTHTEPLDSRDHSGCGGPKTATLQTLDGCLASQRHAVSFCPLPENGHVDHLDHPGCTVYRGADRASRSLPVYSLRPSGRTGLDGKSDLK